jgi:hypothetical protein
LFLNFETFIPGGIFATLIPKEDYFSKALYTFDIGQNDLTAGFFSNATIQQINATVPDIVNNFIENIKVSNPFFHKFIYTITHK